MNNVVIDDASLWKDSRDLQLQEFDVPESSDDFLDIEKENVQEEKEHCSSRDVNDQLNMIKLNEPTAEIIVTLLDVLIPLLFTIVFKGANKENLKLDQQDRDVLLSAWSQYLVTKEFSMSPGAVLATTMLTIYGAKVTIAIMDRNNRNVVDDFNDLTAGKGEKKS